MIPQPSATVGAGFIILPLLVAAIFVVGCVCAARRLNHDAKERRAVALPASAGVLVWLLVTALLGRSGVLARFDLLPPPFALLVLGLFAVAAAVAFSRLGTRLARGLPLWALVGFQVFRLPLELLMHRAYAEGLMPVQMSYSGYNFDIVTGITAGALGLWLAVGQPPRSLVLAWNLLGSVLLANIITIAVISTPLFHAFGNERLNVFVAYFPFVWLPAVLVRAALLGHLLLWRRLASEKIVQAS
jgi:small-conductance mechanosensitive channel